MHASPLYKGNSVQSSVNFDNAKRHVERKLGFLAHFAVYALVNSVLIVLALLFPL